MEKLLSLYNIKMVWFLDASNVSRNYAFSSKMLANDIGEDYITIWPAILWINFKHD
jgi:hypothetical protein